MTKNTHGGKRQNAGRKPSPKKHIKKSIALLPDEYEIINQNKGTQSFSRYVVDSALERSQKK